MIDTNSRISIMQHNTARSTNIMHSCLEIAIKSSIDFVLIQEFWIAVDNIITVSHAAYYCILSNSQNFRSRVAIYARKQANLTYY